MVRKGSGYPTNQELAKHRNSDNSSIASEITRFSLKDGLSALILMAFKVVD